jgi:alpha-beta hydrolase superfamily lysophospholipase
LAITNAPQTAAAAVREEAVTAPIRGGNLSGTILLPEGDGPFPVALIVAGSGPTDRDGNSGTQLRTDAYKKLATGLAARGIATLRYDKRGIGASRTELSEADVRFDDFVDDALALCSLLARDRRFGNVSIIGHSEGSLIGILAAQRDAHIKAFVSLEGPGRNLATILGEQVRANPNNPPAIIAEVDSINASLLTGKTVANPDPLLAPLFRPSVQPFLISLYRYDPAKEIAKLTIPALIVQGTTDLQVSLVDAAALAAGATHATPLTLDGMNHILVDAPADRAGNAATYENPALPLDAKLVPAIASFLAAAR